MRETIEDTAGPAARGRAQLYERAPGTDHHLGRVRGLPLARPVNDLHPRRLEWYEDNLPDDMCVIGSGGFAHFAEYLTWLMGYETLCYALYDQRDLVAGHQPSD